MKTMKRVVVAVALVLAGVVATEQTAMAQPAQSYGVVPDCVLYFNFTAAGSSSTYMNYPAPSGTGGGVCTAWVMSYTAYGFSALSLTLQSAGATAGSQITPGSWGTYSGTVVLGSNPATTITGAQVYFANDTVSTPFIRVNLSGLTGTGRVWGAVYGYKTGYTGGGGGPTTACPGTTSEPCVVVGPVADGAAASGAPVQVAGVDNSGNVQTVKTSTDGALTPSHTVNSTADGVAATRTPSDDVGNPLYYRMEPLNFNGSTFDRQFSCSNQATITFTAASGSLQVVGLTASQIIYVCHLSLSSDTATNITVQYGTGSNCGTGTTAITGAYQNVLSLSLSFAPGSGLKTAASNALCVNSSATATIGGVVTYAKF